MMLALIPEAAAVGILAGAFVAVAGALGLLVKGYRKAKKMADERQDAFEWVWAQMAENGKAHEAGTQGRTWRDVLDSLVISVGRLDDNQKRQGINVREQADKLANLTRLLDDHLLEAQHAIEQLSEHLAHHNELHGEQPE